MEKETEGEIEERSWIGIGRKGRNSVIKGKSN
jgi:hypothetical protein